ncbi:Orct [Bugula neritina]|uniref:Orct n=1 Tax=Bugula neritina TaxID=10212 RepID=A0A7J7IWM4_BUGNE|nr:Orct [Bugula neritina]
MQKLSAIEEDGKFSSCEIYDRNYTWYNSDAALESLNGSFSSHPTNKTEGILECTWWHFNTSEFHSTVQSQWSLVCSKAYVKPLMQTLYMCGFLVGAITFGILSDKYGRLKILSVCLLLQIVFAVAAALVSIYSHYILFTLLRVVVGMVTAGLFTVTFVLVMEVIPPRFRTYTGLFYQGFFAAGFCLLPAISYALRDLFYTQLAMTLPTVIFLSYYWIVPESPRWLILKRKYKEAESILRRIAALNKCPLTDDFTVESLISAENASEHKPVGIKSLLSKPRMRSRGLLCAYAWFVCGLTYYGTSFSAEKLGGDIFLNSLLSGLVEFPAYVVCFFITGHPRIGRKYSLAGSFFVGGVSLLACIPLLNQPDKHILLLVLANIGKLGCSAAFAIVYIFTAEIFPTVVRAASVGGCSLCARIGALLSSPIMELWSYWFGLPYMLFGALAVVAGGLTFLLPESVNAVLPETVEDGEMFGSKLYGENPSDQIPANNEGNKPSAEIPLTEECASN